MLLVEFASTTYQMELQALQASYAFASTLKKDDWVAVISYAMKPEILVDFTQDKNAIQQALNGLRMPMGSETWEFEALYDTLDRLDRIEGHKYLIFVSTGVDTGLVGPQLYPVAGLTVLVTALASPLIDRLTRPTDKPRR